MLLSLTLGRPSARRNGSRRHSGAALRTLAVFTYRHGENLSHKQTESKWVKPYEKTLWSRGTLRAGRKQRMPRQATIKRAREDRRVGKSASTQAGEFVREEFHHIREGKHGARSPQQAIAIGLSKARRAGVRLPPPGNGRLKKRSRQQARRDYDYGSHSHPPPSRKRSRAVLGALKREGRRAASHSAIGRQARAAAHRRTAGQRSQAAHKAARMRASR